eukprot:1159607-Pelagomonas_calceolata.AAC.5
MGARRQVSSVRCSPGVVRLQRGAVGLALTDDVLHSLDLQQWLGSDGQRPPFLGPAGVNAISKAKIQHKSVCKGIPLMKCICTKSHVYSEMIAELPMLRLIEQYNRFISKAKAN